MNLIQVKLCARTAFVMWCVVCGLGCQVVDSRTVSLVLDPIPSQWSNVKELRYYLRWYDAQGKPQLHIANSSNLPRVTVAPLGHTPVYVVPVTEYGHPLSPAGAVYPVGLVHSSLRLSWDKGCIAEFLHAHFPYMHGYYYTNVPRFINEVLKRSKNKNCWVDYQKVEPLLREQRMRSTGIRLAPLYEHIIDFPAGTWYPTDLALTNAITHPGGELALPPLPAGVQIWYHEETQLRATIQIDDSRALAIFSTY